MVRITRRRFLQNIVLGSGALAARMVLEPIQIVASPSSSGPSPSGDLSPDVVAFIANNYLSHATEFPDPNEPVEVLRLYLAGRKETVRGNLEWAVAVFSQAVQLYPDSRHAHAGLGGALLERYRRLGRRNDLHTATEEFLRAVEIGMDFEQIHYTGGVAQALALLGDEDGLRSFFDQILQAGYDRYPVPLHCAQGLAMLGNPEAEQWLQRAVQLQPFGNIDALAYYAEWLLDHDQLDELLAIISPDEHIEYLHFLRSVAWERVGQIAQARSEYERYIEFSQYFPAPARFRIEDSLAQEGIVFDDEGNQGSHCLPTISKSIYAEASIETQGGMRAVGWTMRTRVFISPRPDGCTNFHVSHIPLDPDHPCDRYTHIIVDHDQFQECHVTEGCISSPTTDHVAYDVYYGLAPQNITNWCPDGSEPLCNECDGSCHCVSIETNGAGSWGPIYMWGTCAPCPTTHPAAPDCTHNHGKLCGNGCPDNCFYNVH